MILSGHQPVYLPGIILFNKISLSDKFIFVGHCQYCAGSWHNHNQIRNAKLIVPVNAEFGQAINDVRIAGDHWKRKHLRAMEFNYSRRPFFNLYFPKLKCCIEKQWNYLGPMNMALIELICIFLGIIEIDRRGEQISGPKIIDGREYDIEGAKTEMLKDMCDWVDATEYLSNEGARAYVDEQSMADAGITHRWQKFTHPIYDQGDKEFQTNLSVIDLLFNCGPASGDIVKRAGYVCRQ